MALCQIVSDLHLETYPSYGDFKLSLTDARYIALLGDIGHVGNDALYRFFTELVNHYDIVFFLFGNHEAYECTMEAAKARMRSFETRMGRLNQERTIGKFVFLDQTRYDVSGTLTVLGCTLFSQIRDEQKVEVGMRFVDFKRTLGWTVEHHNAAHKADLDWLNAQVAKIGAVEPQRQIIVFTHHSPTVHERANDPRHRDSSVNSGFVTDLSHEMCWTSENVRMWAFGHTHYNCDFRDATGKKIVANQKGYYQKLLREGEGFNSGFDDRITYLVPDGETYIPVHDEDDHPKIEGGVNTTSKSKTKLRWWQDRIPMRKRRLA